MEKFKLKILVELLFMLLEEKHLETIFETSMAEMLSFQLSMETFCSTESISSVLIGLDLLDIHSVQEPLKELKTAYHWQEASTV